MSNVLFSHNFKEEKKYIEDLYLEKDWFDRENFPVIFPEHKNAFEKEIVVRKKIMQKNIGIVIKDWSKIENVLFENVRKWKHINIQAQYFCHFSNFGPEGKYHLPHYLFIRLNTPKDIRKATETVAHELCHLIFACYFEKRELSYQQKEAVVDYLIMNTDLQHFFPHYRPQNLAVVPQNIVQAILENY